MAPARYRGHEAFAHHGLHSNASGIFLPLGLPILPECATIKKRKSRICVPAPSR
ncbi:hypothetical protein ASAP_2759 [Asaia bogorensis]|uniref:Uncharacterized protein n=1 Tax=Asaia bogorensis TaxID=91915 RepID=A0A060QI31_9PROT|nr:hypothetical protein ASAP_2759 [Asaia bogorensis]